MAPLADTHDSLDRGPRQWRSLGLSGRRSGQAPVLSLGPELLLGLVLGFLLT